MNDDLLKRATRALRSHPCEDDERAPTARARILGGLRQAQVRRRTWSAVVLPLAATLAAATAFGATNHRVGKWIRAVTSTFEPATKRSQLRLPGEERALPSAAAPNRPLVEVESRPNSEASPEAAPEMAERPVPPVTSPKRGQRREQVVPRNVHQRAKKPGSESAAALDLFSAAHRAHFAGGDHEAALRAWDSYLAADPEGSFELEARYNRAICLLRLGRVSEARTALAPFAEGRFGDYRRDEAVALLARFSE
jgi:tetratricopeptide (TPR) repeat protein